LGFLLLTGSLFGLLLDHEDGDYMIHPSVGWFHRTHGLISQNIQPFMITAVITLILLYFRYCLPNIKSTLREAEIELNDFSWNISWDKNCTAHGIQVSGLIKLWNVNWNVSRFCEFVTKCKEKQLNVLHL
jgi:hypothetical protein